MSKYLSSDTSKQDLIDISEGQLYIVRPHSPKGFSELIFRDCVASIRRTGQQYNYQLVVQRAYEEGEEELTQDEGGSEEDVGTDTDRDERTFLLDQDLRFRAEINENEQVVFAWEDLSGDVGDLYEFVCATSVKPERASSFSLVAAQCQFERRYRQPRDKATEEQLQEFHFQQDAPIPQASPITSPTRSPRLSPSLANTSLVDSPDLSLLSSRTMARETHLRDHATPSSKSSNVDSAAASATPGRRSATAKVMPRRTYDEHTTVAPSAVARSFEGLEILANESAELHLFDFKTGTFVMQDKKVTVKVSEMGRWKYWLGISGDKREWLGQEIGPDLNPVFNFDYLSFIFNHQATDGAMYSWLLRFTDRETEEQFQEGLMRALWEHSNETKWLKAKDNDRDYVLDAFNDLVVEDDREAEAREEDEAEHSDEDEDEDEALQAQLSEEYDTDEDEDDVVLRDEDGNVNSQLAVGTLNDRSFVVRGSKIGVFKHTPGNALEFSTNISKVQTPKGKLFSPTKVMLHEGDRNMVLQNKDDPHALYRMDLEYGKVVDEWKVHDDIPVTSFAPSSVSRTLILILKDTNHSRNLHN